MYIYFNMRTYAHGWQMDGIHWSHLSQVRHTFFNMESYVILDYSSWVMLSQVKSYGRTHL